jgi:DNA-binding IscR family transcriptional regulator
MQVISTFIRSVPSVFEKKVDMCIGKIDITFRCKYNGYIEEARTMKISSRFTIAVHVMSLLSISKDAHCTSEWIARSVNTNPVIIRNVLGKLKRAGLAQVRSGTGGAYLVREAEDISLLDIFHAVDVVEEGQLFHFHAAPNPECPVGANIEFVLNVILRRAQGAMEAIFAEIPLSELVEGFTLIERS